MVALTLTFKPLIGERAPLPFADSYTHTAQGGDEGPLVEDTLPNGTVGGYSHANLDDISGIGAANIGDVRFYCETDRHDRVIHFKTEHAVVRQLAWDGARGADNTPAVWSTGFTALPGHSAHLPAETNMVGSSVLTGHTSHGGFTGYLIDHAAENWHWTVRRVGGGGAWRWECDDWIIQSGPANLGVDLGSAGWDYNTRHLVFVRLRDLPAVTPPPSTSTPTTAVPSTSVPTATSIPTPSPTPSPTTPEPTTSSPTPSPTPEPTSSPTPAPTLAPTPAPTMPPTPAPSNRQTRSPSPPPSSSLRATGGDHNEVSSALHRRSACLVASCASANVCQRTCVM